MVIVVIVVIVVVMVVMSLFQHEKLESSRVDDALFLIAWFGIDQLHSIQKVSGRRVQ